MNINIVQKRVKTAVAAMLTKSREDHSSSDGTLTEEEKWEKEQTNLVLRTGWQKIETSPDQGIISKAVFHYAYFAFLCGILDSRFVSSLSGLYHADIVAWAEIRRKFMP